MKSLATQDSLVLVIRSCTYQLLHCSAEVALKHPAPEPSKPNHAFQLSFKLPFHSVALLHISRELKYPVRVNILYSLGHAGAKMNSWTPLYIMNQGFRSRDGEACFCSSTFMAFTDHPPDHPPSNFFPTLSHPKTQKAKRDSLLPAVKRGGNPRVTLNAWRNS